MGQASVVYRIVLLLHIAAAIVGIGGVIAHGAYNARAFAAKARDARVLLATTQLITNASHYAIYGILILGVILVSLSDGAISMGAPWISASFVVWIAIVGVAHGLIKPTVKGLAAVAEETADDTVLSQEAKAVALAKKLALGEGITQLLVVVALYLMVWQPG